VTVITYRYSSFCKLQLCQPTLLPDFPTVSAVMLSGSILYLLRFCKRLKLILSFHLSRLSTHIWRPCYDRSSCSNSLRKRSTKIFTYSLHANIFVPHITAWSHMPDCWLEVSIQKVSATGYLDTGFSWLPCVYKRMLRWFPSFQVATTCFSRSPPDLNFLVTFFFHICVHVK